MPVSPSRIINLTFIFLCVLPAHLYLLGSVELVRWEQSDELQEIPGGTHSLCRFSVNVSQIMCMMFFSVLQNRELV